MRNTWFSERVGRRGWGRGQAMTEYMLMTVLLLLLFTGLYTVLQGQMKNVFTRAGVMILVAYY